MGSTGLPSGGVGVVLSTLCGGIRVRPNTICATARRPGKANQKEDGTGGMVCVYPQRARRIYQLGRVPGESEEAPGERHTVSMSATADPSSGRSSFASGVSYLRQMWPPHACGDITNGAGICIRITSVDLLPLGVENSNASASLGMILTWPLASCCWRPSVR